MFDSCIAKWLNQAGVKADYVKLEEVGLPGNAHEMMLEKNSDGIAKFLRAGSRRTCTEPTDGERPL